jgi:DNA polymerase-1
LTRTLLFDGDIFAYQAAVAAEEPTHWGDGFWTLHAYEAPAKAWIAGQLDSYVEALEADAFIVVLSDPCRKYFRHDLNPEYKADRVTKRKPLILNSLKQYLATEFPSYIREGLEADDVLGILATSDVIVKGEKVIVSVDKDFYTIPGYFYRMREERPEIYRVSLAEADYWHMYQTLVGDRTDGYAGCPGVGKVTAGRILKPHYSDVPDGQTAMEQWWPQVREAFAKKKLPEMEAILQARMARILRKSDYDFKQKEVILWNPPCILDE